MLLAVEAELGSRMLMLVLEWTWVVLLLTLDTEAWTDLKMVISEPSPPSSLSIASNSSSAITRNLVGRTEFST